MSEKDVAIARAAAKGGDSNLERLRRSRAGGAFDSEAFFALLADDVIWDLSRSQFPEAGVYRGVDAVRAWFSGLRDAFGDFRYELEKEREHGDQVLSQVRLIGRGPGSQIPVEYTFVPVMTFRDGKIVRMDRYDTWEEATKAVGLSGD
jgi:ketosteroid isomerase-like protein